MRKQNLQLKVSHDALAAALDEVGLLRAQNSKLKDRLAALQQHHQEEAQQYHNQTETRTYPQSAPLEDTVEESLVAVTLKTHPLDGDTAQDQPMEVKARVRISSPRRDRERDTHQTVNSNPSSSSSSACVHTSGSGVQRLVSEGPPSPFAHTVAEVNSSEEDEIINSLLKSTRGGQGGVSEGIAVRGDGATEATISRLLRELLCRLSEAEAQRDETAIKLSVARARASSPKRNAQRARTPSPPRKGPEETKKGTADSASKSKRGAVPGGFVVSAKTSESLSDSLEAEEEESGKRRKKKKSGEEGERSDSGDGSTFRARVGDVRSDRLPRESASSSSSRIPKGMEKEGKKEERSKFASSKNLEVLRGERLEEERSLMWRQMFLKFRRRSTRTYRKLIASRRRSGRLALLLDCCRRRLRVERDEKEKEKKNSQFWRTEWERERMSCEDSEVQRDAEIERLREELEIPRFSLSAAPPLSTTSVNPHCSNLHLQQSDSVLVAPGALQTPLLQDSARCSHSSRGHVGVGGAHTHTTLAFSQPRTNPFDQSISQGASPERSVLTERSGRRGFPSSQTMDRREGRPSSAGSLLIPPFPISAAASRQFLISSGMQLSRSALEREDKYPRQTGFTLSSRLDAAADRDRGLTRSRSGPIHSLSPAILTSSLPHPSPKPPSLHSESPPLSPDRGQRRSEPPHAPLSTSLHSPHHPVSALNSPEPQKQLQSRLLSGGQGPLSLSLNESAPPQRKTIDVALPHHPRTDLQFRLSSATSTSLLQSKSEAARRLPDTPPSQPIAPPSQPPALGMSQSAAALGASRRPNFNTDAVRRRVSFSTALRQHGPGASASYKGESCHLTEEGHAVANEEDANGKDTSTLPSPRRLRSLYPSSSGLDNNREPNIGPESKGPGKTSSPQCRGPGQSMDLDTKSHRSDCSLSLSAFGKGRAEPPGLSGPNPFASLVRQESQRREREEGEEEKESFQDHHTEKGSASGTRTPSPERDLPSSPHVSKGPPESRTPSLSASAFHRDRSKANLAALPVSQGFAPPTPSHSQALKPERTEALEPPSLSKSSERARRSRKVNSSFESSHKMPSRLPSSSLRDPTETLPQEGPTLDKHRRPSSVGTRSRAGGREDFFRLHSSPLPKFSPSTREISHHTAGGANDALFLRHSSCLASRGSRKAHDAHVRAGVGGLRVPKPSGGKWDSSLRLHLEKDSGRLRVEGYYLERGREASPVTTTESVPVAVPCGGRLDRVVPVSLQVCEGFGNMGGGGFVLG
uniref:Uncharacterized protein n=1 Tax=Chromera velia CCMP2878 TaxID=1169474 RepID=A0A0G4IG12_9ALVE|eukprot:Cvel_2527.t1-p1 / transcript=Cvel_2527.t1 / gene=Cvel_2527 / organism=Chromera_velia_CCMP2878 / gene_product=hypothetical protein / transcript_product=hypothetical protein / location=Cvel_scaffold99:128121-135052(+) / protein_length=1264 / sequence_SO=supercontig / SO=protein_coding / is_pseudo=false